jgi:hypothetical protein
MGTVTASELSVTGHMLGSPQLMVFTEEKAASTHAGTFTSGAWRTRILTNTYNYNSATFTTRTGATLFMQAGTYYCKAWGVAWAVNDHQLRVQQLNNTAKQLLVGAQTRASSGGEIAFVSGVFTIAVNNTQVQLQHRCETTKTTDGFGTAGGWTTEVYSSLSIWRIQ